MRKIFCMLFLFFSLTSIEGLPKVGWNYIISLGNCIVQYGGDWGTLTVKTALCAWNKATLQA